MKNWALVACPKSGVMTSYDHRELEMNNDQKSNDSRHISLLFCDLNALLNPCSDATFVHVFILFDAYLDTV